MFNFIFCDDEEEIRKKIAKIIRKLMTPLEVEYKTYETAVYDQKFESLINKSMNNKIYILDIEVLNKSGLNIAKLIKEKDSDAKIIILTAHNELAYEVFQKRLKPFHFISKLDNYEKILFITLKSILNMVKNNPSICFKYKSTMYKINLDDIIYISKNNDNRHTIIKTSSKEYMTSIPLINIAKKLDDRFYRTHRACIVNKEKIISVDYKNNKIDFTNGEESFLLSNNYKKGLKNLVFN